MDYLSKSVELVDDKTGEIEMKGDAEGIEWNQVAAEKKVPVQETEITTGVLNAVESTNQ